MVSVEPVLCGLCHERPLVLNDRFHRHGLFLIDICTTCYERPSVLRDRFCWAEGVVAQDRFYCTICFNELDYFHVNIYEP